MTSPLFPPYRIRRQNSPGPLVLPGTKKRRDELRTLLRFSSQNNGQAEGGQRLAWQECQLRPGVWLSLLDQCGSGEHAIRYQKSNAFVDFGFTLEGRFTNRLRGADGTREILNQAGLGGVGFLPEVEGVVEIPEQERMRVLHIHVEREMLGTLLEDDMDHVPGGFAKILEGRRSHAFLQHGKVEPAVLASVRELTDGLRTGLPRRMFLEGKALELVAMQLFWLHGREKGACGACLSPDERDRVLAAKDALVEDLAYPPTLRVLSQRFNLSINKLQSGFQEIFGSTVYGFLKEFKLQKAQLLFQEADLNVSEVAWEVGYINISHFSAAFKKRFGILPKQYLNSVRRLK